MNTNYTIKKDPYSSHTIILQNIPKKTKILDIGCWNGKIGQQLKKKQCTITGIEKNPTAAKKAKKILHKVHNTDIQKFNTQKKYDIIIFGDILEHLPNPQETLQKSTKWLKNKGKIIISIPNFINIYVRTKILLGNFDYDQKGILDKTHLTWFTQKTLTKMIQKSGLKINHLTTTPIPLPLIHPFFKTRIGKYIHTINAKTTKVWPNLLAYQFIAITSKKKKKKQKT